MHLADTVNPDDIVIIHNIHNGEDFETISVDSYDSEMNTITFKTDSFSTYAIATAVTSPYYSVIEGANGKWTQNSNGTLTFRIDGDFSKFTGVKVDGKLLDAKNYTAVSGSTVITLKADYLKTLSAASHKLTVVYSDGECSTNFEVAKAESEQRKPTDATETETKSPQTGDNSNMMLRFTILIAGVAGVFTATVYGRKKKYSVKSNRSL